MSLQGTNKDKGKKKTTNIHIDLYRAGMKCVYKYIYTYTGYNGKSSMHLVCMYIWICTSVCMYRCIYERANVYMYNIGICAYMYASIYIYVIYIYT